MPKEPSPERVVYFLKKGWVHNPLMDLPVNMKCPCGSNRKFKKCCLPLTHRYIRETDRSSYEHAKKNALAGEKAW